MIEKTKDIANEYGKNLKLSSLASFFMSAVEINCTKIFLPFFNSTSLSSMIKELSLLFKFTLILSPICTSSSPLFPLITTFISLLLEKNSKDRSTNFKSFPLILFEISSAFA